MKYYEVKAKCGHVGRNKYILKDFYVCAENGKEAALKVRHSPRVKHNHKDAIRNVTEISYSEYISGLDRCSNDAYFLVHSSSEQRLRCSFEDNEILREEIKVVREKRTHTRRKMIDDGLVKDWALGRSYLYE